VEGFCNVNVPALQIDGGSTDPNGDPLTFTAFPPGPYPAGEITEVQLTVADPDGNFDLCTARITVEGTVGPCVSDPGTLPDPHFKTFATRGMVRTQLDSCFFLDC